MRLLINDQLVNVDFLLNSWLNSNILNTGFRKRMMMVIVMFGALLIAQNVNNFVTITVDDGHGW